MNFTITDDQKHTDARPIQVGWFLIDDKTSIHFEAPYRMREES